MEKIEAPDAAKLGNWIHSWIQKNGAIYGFHNHSVWGSNPYRLGDFTSDHTTFASPFLPGLTKALVLEMNPEGLALLNRLIDFQTSSFQENGQYKHVGYQTGETVQSTLIHNAITNVSLLLTADLGIGFLDDKRALSIRKAVERNLTGTLGWGGGRPDENTCCNQDYTRIWSKLLYQRVYKDQRYSREIIEDLAFMERNFHERGIPDKDCLSTYRNISTHRNTLEPSEYYGLMINPLIEAYQQFGKPEYLDQAKGICLHVIRSSWVDKNKQRRFHKMYVKVLDTWDKINDTMLISGMAMTLMGIEKCHRIAPDREFQDFLDQCRATYAFYQTERGFFVSATGWSCESDIAPCTAWHGHDFFYLVDTLESLPPYFWQDFFSESPDISILLGESGIWVEDKEFWGVVDYFGCGLYGIFGRKNHNKFALDIGWILSNRRMEDFYHFTECPVFYNFDDKVVIETKGTKKLLVNSIIDKKIIISPNQAR